MHRSALAASIACCMFAASGAAQPVSVAVFPIQARGVDSNTVSIIEEALGGELLKSGKFRLLERSQMESILREQGFQQSGTCDASECAVQVGRILGVQQGVVGSLGLLGRTWVLNARLIDVGTGEVLNASRRSITGEIDLALTELVPMAAADLARSGGKTADQQAKSEPPADPKVKNGSSSAWIWWTLGGVAVAGGAAAAVVLMNDGGNGGTTPPVQEQPSDNTLPVTVTLP